MTRFEILSETHTIHIADHEKDQKWVFSKNKDHDGPEISLGGVRKIVHSTDSISISAPSYEDVTLQDVPEELFDFLDSEGYHTEWARSVYQF